MRTITLYHYDFESDNQNVLLFDSKTSRDAYFNNIAESDKVKIQDINFFANDLLNTRVYVRVDSLSLFTILNYNYAIVTDSDDATHPLFFYIQSSKQDSGGQIEITLKCDIANTYFYDIDFNVVQAIVKRAHLDRFRNEPISNDFYFLDVGAKSKLYEREIIKDLSKRVTQQSDIYISYNGQFKNTTQSASHVVRWLYDNVECWKYYFLDKDISYKYYKFGGNTQQNDVLPETKYIKANTKPVTQLNHIDQSTHSNFVILVVPIYKKINDKKIYFTTTNGNYQWTETGIEQFLKDNNQYAHVKCIKYSIKPPLFCRMQEFDAATISQSNNLIVDVSNLSYGTGLEANPLNIYRTNTDTIAPDLMQAIYSLNMDNIESLKAYIADDNWSQTNLLDWFYAKSRIKAHNDIEPKLLNEDYSIYKIMLGGQQFNLPILKTDYSPEFDYNEVISPDTTKAILTYYADPENIKIKMLDENFEPIFNPDFTSKDFTGFIIDIDLSMWYVTSQLDTYLANNKNYMQILNNKIMGGLVKNLTQGAIVGALTGNVSGAVTGAITGTAGSLISALTSYKELDYTLDNMANAPENTSAINSNAMLISSENKIGLIIEKLEPIGFEKKILLDYFRQFGYTYNKVDTIANVMRSRKYYNYIQANIFEIPAKIGNNIKEEIKKMFSNGIRLWHADTFEGVDFTLNNYERFIDEQEN